MTTEIAPPAVDFREELDTLARRLGLTHLDETLRFPKYVLLETVRLCNARCSMCAINLWSKDVPKMSDEIFARVVDELVQYSSWIVHVCLHGAGEPLIDKKLAKRVATLKQRGIPKVVTTTNGSLLNEKRARELLEAGIDQIALSIDSLVPAVYEKIRAGLTFEETMANAKRLISLRDEIRPETVIKVVLTEGEDNKGEGPAFLRFWRERLKPSDRVEVHELHSYGNQLDHVGQIPAETWPVNPCISVWSTMVVNADGRVPLCCLDYDAKVEMGRVEGSSLLDIWRGEMFRKMRDLHATGRRNEIVHCRGCRMWDVPVPATSA